MKAAISLSILLVLCMLPADCRLPKGFIFGSATSALQTEGAWLEDDKSFTEWDDFGHTLGLVSDGTNADTTCDGYHKFAQDIALLKQYGIKHYRMSIQWARVMPYAKNGTAINLKAVAHYRQMLRMMKEAGIVAYANICHNDVPAVLYMGGKGLADPDFPLHYSNYADQCFRLFGDLVQYWFTFDEPWCHSVDGPFEKGEEATKPYQIAHNLLLAHATAVKIYREKYQATQRGKIGLNLNGAMHWPNDPNSQADKEAANRYLIFLVGWFWNPIMKGEYPAIMRERVGARLPEFTPEQKAMVKGSADFFALNHYYSFATSQGGFEKRTDYYSDINATAVYRKEWKVSDVGFSIVPKGMHDLLLFIHKTWLEGTNLPVFVTENGVSVPEPNNSAAISDRERIDYMYSYMSEMERAIADGVNVVGYFAWSLMDNFEWGNGLAIRFGMTRVDYEHDFQRIPKASLKWFSELIKENAY